MKKKIFDKYANAIASEFHLSIEEVFEKSKRSDITTARQMLYYLCFERPLRIASIRRFLAEYGYDLSHSNILHNYRKGKEKIDSDPDYKELIKKIQNEIH
tara:strand:+ start:162 stop:461 length:300 start_codon:yes stop_codon:yes gene_type:complete